jgi:hypothetical protein
LSDFSSEEGSVAKAMREAVLAWSLANVSFCFGGAQGVRRLYSLMKTHCFALVAVLLSSTAFAQTNTYPFPASGSVGIGTISPGAYKLSVNNPAGYGILSTAGYSDTVGGRRNVTLNAGSGDWWAMGVSNDGGFALDFLDPNGGGAAPFNSLVAKSTGNIGIGTTAPNQRLSINGNLSVGTTGSFIMMGESAFTGGGGYIFLKSTGDYGRDFNIQNYSNAAGWRTNLFVAGESGNVGIGTSSPSELLAIGSSTDAPNIRLSRWAFLGQESHHLSTVLGSNAGVSGDSTVVAESSVDGYRAIRMRYDAGITFHSYLGSVTAGDAIGHERVRITPSGNVGIGTTNPTHKLAVNGTIKAKEVIVETTGWSDYVLAKTYKLQSLSEVEAHINDNGHLPGIPSAAQVAEQGVSIGDMQARLLAKIEELTLHQIAQEKELAALRTEVRALRDNQR